MTATATTPARKPYARSPVASIPDVGRELQKIERQQAGLFQPRVITHALSPYTIQATDWFIVADCTAGAVSIVFPRAAGLNGLEVAVVKADSTTNAVTLTGTISGFTNTKLASQYMAKIIKSGNAVWYFTVGGATSATGASWIGNIDPATIPAANFPLGWPSRAQLTLVEDDAAQPVDFFLVSYRGSIGGSNGIEAYFARGTAAAPTIVANNDQLLNIAGHGYDGTQWTTHDAVRLTAFVDGTPGVDQIPGRWECKASDASGVLQTCWVATATAFVPKLLLDISASAAGQIKFPATQHASANAQTFDDCQKKIPYTATQTNLTVVLGGGAVTYTGTYTKFASRVFVQVRITPSGGATTAATAALTYFSIPFTPINDDVSYAADASNGAGLGTALLYVVGRMYTPAWAATSDAIIVSASFDV